MQLTFLSKSVRTIGSLFMLLAITGMSITQPAQAQPKEKMTACSAAYFDDPDYMYNPVSKEQQDAIDRFSANPARIGRLNRIQAEIKTFSVALDAPVGYVAKTVNGKPIAIPAKLAKEMYNAAFNANRNPKATRRRVAELNKKYAPYATFGQQINLLFSPEQIRENSKIIHEINAFTASVMTPEQRKAEQEQLKKDFGGVCPSLENQRADRITYVTIEVGVRPDLDKRLREDTTGATFFK
ncbi:hypothetical protein IQ250_21945 [Pseudanabaenaceae cyanobacterium LEGE 13415]|nr:hypothetical protein [Pseudanabaenaceae cyanobacterium LEGE 13415]